MREERRDVDALIEQLVRESNLPDARAREELRRELASHFEEAGSSPEAIRVAIERFGSAEGIADGFRRAYRRGRPGLYAAKVLASVVASTAAALALQLLANLRIGANGEIMHLGSGYVISACFSLAIVLLLVAAWELDVEPLCARLERRPVRLLAIVGALFATIYVGHPLVHGPMGIHTPVDVTLVLVGSAAGAAVWTCTVAIVARIDLAYANLFGPRGR